MEFRRQMNDQSTSTGHSNPLRSGTAELIWNFNSAKVHRRRGDRTGGRQVLAITELRRPGHSDSGRTLLLNCVNIRHHFDVKKSTKLPKIKCECHYYITLFFAKNLPDLDRD